MIGVTSQRFIVEIKLFTLEILELMRGELSELIINIGDGDGIERGKWGCKL